MKNTFVALLAVVAFAGTAFAGDIIEMKKDVKFNHKVHAATVGDCTKCHATTAGGKIDGFGKEWAHKSCKGCHTELKKGPASCKECHKK